MLQGVAARLLETARRGCAVNAEHRRELIDREIIASMEAQQRSLLRGEEAERVVHGVSKRLAVPRAEHLDLDAAAAALRSEQLGIVGAECRALAALRVECLAHRDDAHPADERSLSRVLRELRRRARGAAADQELLPRGLQHVIGRDAPA